jgi:hypothetical protein
MRWFSLPALEEFLDIWLNIVQIQSKIGTCAKSISVFCFLIEGAMKILSHKDRLLKTA